MIPEVNSLGSQQKVIQAFHRIGLIIYIPLILIIIGFASQWTFLTGEQDKYYPPTSPADNWRACLIQPSLVTLPLNETSVYQKSIAQPLLTECILNYNSCVTDDGFDCVLFGVAPCVKSAGAANTIMDPQLPMGQFAQALAAVGLQAVVFSLIGHGTLDRALRHPSWIPPSIALLCWILFAMITFYSVNPVLPVPNSTNATLAVLIRYMRMSKFDDMNYGNNKCDTAFEYIWVYIASILGVILVSFLNLLLCCYAQYVRVGNKALRAIAIPLDSTLPAQILCFLSMVCYVMMAGGKASTSMTVIEAIEANDVSVYDAPATPYEGTSRTFWYGPYFFPFQNVTLDFSTLLFINSFMSIIRGATTHSKSAYKLAAVTAATFAVVGYPPIIGGINFYYYNNFNKWSDCYGYFLQGGSISPIFGYPDKEQAELYCMAFRCSVIGEIGLWICMHFLIIACIYAYVNNKDRDSFTGNSYRFNAEVTNALGQQSNNPVLTEALITANKVY